MTPASAVATTTAQLRYESIRQRYEQLPLAEPLRSADGLGSMRCGATCSSGRRAGQQCARIVRTNIEPASCSPQHDDGLPPVVLIECIDLEAAFVSNVRQLGFLTFEHLYNMTEEMVRQKQLAETTSQLQYCTVTAEPIIELMDDNQSMVPFGTYRDDDSDTESL